MRNDYGLIKNNIVVNIAVFEDPTEELLNHFKTELELDEIVLATKKTVLNGTYDGSKFWFPQPYPSWIKNEELNEWAAPVTHPGFDTENPVFYVWNEELLNWEEVAE
jgi:hypothetical protein